MVSSLQLSDLILFLIFHEFFVVLIFGETLSRHLSHYVRQTDKRRGQLRNADARSLLKPVASSEARHHDNTENSISHKRQLNQSLEHASVSK